MMLLSLKYLYFLPRRAIESFFKALRYHLPAYGATSSLVDGIFRDPRTYESVIDLKVTEDQLVICPACMSSYPIEPNGPLKDLHCNFEPSPQSKPCGHNLYQERGKKLKPVMTFHRRKFDDWIQGILVSCGDIQRLDLPWDRVGRAKGGIARDIWDGEYVQSLQGPNIDAKFSSVPKDETRLLLALAVDWFNPFHNRLGGKNASSGVLFMTCLNLPPEERLKEENVYLIGILPGRKQQTHLDELLQPLINDLLRYWETGVHFIGIPGLELPHLIQCALIQLICDLPAARKVAGFLGHSASSNCSVCFALRRNLVDISSAYDPNLFRSSENHRKKAAQYKDILDRSGRNEAERFLKSDPQGVRWSELNRLPYWNPIQCTVLDAMHLILLGVCQFHWRRFWGGDNVTKSRTASNGVSSNKISRKEVFTRLFDIGHILSHHSPF